ncbi:MAG: hypothetical protein ACRC2B_10565, partial [Rubrivivax sp.]
MLNAIFLPSWLSVAMVTLAAYVTLELCHRVRHRDPGHRNAWLMAAAVGLSGGIWSAQVLALGNGFASMSVGFHPGIAMSVAIAALALCLAGLQRCITRAPGWPQVITAAAALATATLVAQVGLLLALGLKPGIEWHPGWLGLAWLAGAIGFVLALITYLPLDDPRSLRPRRRQIGAASIAGLTVLICQSLTTSAAGMSGLVPLDDDNLISGANMGTAASTGGAVLLLLLLACAVEMRLRASLDAVRVEELGNSFRDGLTRLPTRSTFEGTLAQAMVQADARKASAVLLHIAL